MKDQNPVGEETPLEKWDRAKTLMLESLYKPDHQLRSCAYNQGCKEELLDIRDQVVELVKHMMNPHTQPLEFGKKNNFKIIMKTRLLLLSMICSFASYASAAPPVVSGVTASQRTGTKIVDVTYNLALDAGQTAFVELWFSPDNGLTFPVRCTAVSGDVNASVTAGNAKSVVWNAEADWDQKFTNNGKIRVIATYGNQPSGFAGTGSGGGSGSGSGSGYGNLNSVPWSPYFVKFYNGAGSTWQNHAVPIVDPGPNGIPGDGDDGAADAAEVAAHLPPGAVSRRR